MAALDYLMAAQQCVYRIICCWLTRLKTPSLAETNEKSRLLLKEKADEYLNRAENIRQRDTRKQPELGVAVNHTYRTAQSVILDVGATVCPCQQMQQLTWPVQEAFKCSKQAIDADASRNYAEAYEQYMKSMDYFMFAQQIGRAHV